MTQLARHRDEIAIRRREKRKADKRKADARYVGLVLTLSVANLNAYIMWSEHQAIELDLPSEEAQGQTSSEGESDSE